MTRVTYEGRRLQQIRMLEVYAGVESGGARRFVAFRIESRERRKVADRYPRSSKGIAVESVEEGAGKLAIFLREQADVPLGVFPTVMADVLESASAAASGRELATALDRFASWQAALSRQTGDLSAQEVRGIFGEIVVCRDIIVPRAGIGRAIKMWRAPEDDHIHDFVGTTWELEVKTMLAPTDRFHVSREGQLEPEGMNRMFLAAVTLEESDAGLSLLELEADVLSTLTRTPDLEATLGNALVRRGTRLASHGPEAAKRYRTASIEFFDVRSGFPLIARSTLPGGVSALKYEVSLPACAQFRVGRETFAAQIDTE